MKKATGKAIITAFSHAMRNSVDIPRFINVTTPETTELIIKDIKNAVTKRENVIGDFIFPHYYIGIRREKMFIVL